MHHPVFPDGSPWPELMTPPEAVKALRLDVAGGGRPRSKEAQLRALARLVERAALRVTRIGKERRFSVESVLGCISTLTDGDEGSTSMLHDLDV